MKSKADFFFDNWQLILFFSIFVVVAPFTIYSIATQDKDLSDNKLRNELADQLAKEMKEIPSPPKTAVNKFQSNAKDFNILVQTRYRTELSEKEIIDYFIVNWKKEIGNIKGKTYKLLNFAELNKVQQLIGKETAEFLVTTEIISVWLFQKD
ncbi:MAG TPA: hypothetical protein PKY59_23270 [Pyrinomonadaceae bacterium]|nr:hypothetical protein [Pyrinomonadaceae bacterium]